MLTVGVEEEFLLVDDAGHLSLRGPEVVQAASEPDVVVQLKLARCQLESATGVCESAAELLGQLRQLRAHNHGFAELDEKLLDLYTGATTAALRMYSRYIQARDTAAQLHTALANRAVIDQAKGILMALHQIGADKAFTLLVQQSQRENIKLRDLAARFVAHTTSPQS